MIRSLVSQLSGSSSSLPGSVRSLYAGCEDGEWPASDQELLQALRDVFAALPSYFIVLDVLNECNSTDRLFDVLEEIESWHESPLHVS
jgi:hypothetical protein